MIRVPPQGFISSDDQIYNALKIPNVKSALINAYKNSLFATTTDWDDGGGSATLSVNNGALTGKVKTAAVYSVVRGHTNAPCVSGHKIYFRAIVSTPDDGCVSVVARIWGTTSTSGNYYIPVTLTTPIKNTEYEISGVVAIGSSITGDLYCGVYTSHDVSGKSIVIKQPLLIDLTEYFGAGNEPDATAMNTWLATNGWFPNTADYRVTGVNDGKIVTSTSGKLAMVDFSSFGTWYGKSMLSLGDSITWQDGKNFTTGDEAGQLAIGYQAWLQTNLGISTHVNAGVSGRPMANGTTPGVGTNTTGKAQTYTTHDLVIIAAGSNDFRLDVPLGTLGAIGDTVFDATTFYGAYRDLVEYILTAKPTIRIVLFTPLPRTSEGYDVNYTNPAGHKLIDYVNAVKAVGQMYGLPVCDMFANSGFTNLTFATYLRDSALHPNNAGYARMGDYASKFIKAI